MKQNSTIKKRNKGFLAMILSMFMFVTCAATTVPAYAATPVPAQGGSISVDSCLVKDTDSHTPNATITYTLSAAEVSGGTEKDDYPVFAGVLPENKALTQTVAFSASDDESVTSGMPGEVEEITNGVGYISKDVIFNLEGVSYTQYGIYRYILTQGNGLDYLTYDAQSTRTIDVYVGYQDDNNLTVLFYVVYSDLDDDTKSTGYVNTYSSYDLDLTKQVTGNQGDREKAFSFTVSIENAVPEMTYDVTGNTTNKTVVTDEYGSATYTVELKDDQTIQIKELPKTAVVTIEEKNYKSDDYDTSYTINGGDSTEALKTTDITMTSDQAVVFTNTKSGNIPTGIINEFGPFVLLGAVVLGGFVLLISSRRRRDY